MRIFFAVFLLMILFSQTSQAAKKKKNPAPPAAAPAQDVVVAVPSSEIAIGEVPDYQPKPATIEFGYSSWMPKNFVRGSYSLGNSRFGKGSFPFVSLNRIGKVSNIQEWSLFWKAGIFANSLERTFTIPWGNGNRVLAQKFLLLGIRAGTEVQSPALFRTRAILGAAFLPTFGLSPSSEIEGDVNQFALLGEFAGGFLFQPKFLENFWGFKNGSLTLAAHAVQGKMGDSELNDLAVSGSFRLDL
jgi:hypothetical protein